MLNSDFAYSNCVECIKNNSLLDTPVVHNFLRSVLARYSEKQSADQTKLADFALSELANALRQLAFHIDEHIFLSSLQTDTSIRMEPPGDGLGTSAMAGHVRTFDWSRTALGPIDGWEHQLSSAVRMILGKDHPMSVCWGPDLVHIYNDAALEVFGQEPLGAHACKPWADGWDEIGLKFASVIEDNSPAWFEKRFIPLRRNGRLVAAWWTCSFAPIAVGNDVGGILMAFHETSPPENVPPESRTAG